MLILHCVWVSCIWNENGECSANEVFLDDALQDEESLDCKTFDFRGEKS